MTFIEDGRWVQHDKVVYTPVVVNGWPAGTFEASHVHCEHSGTKAEHGE